MCVCVLQTGRMAIQLLIITCKHLDVASYAWNRHGHVIKKVDASTSTFTHVFRKHTGMANDTNHPCLACCFNSFMHLVLHRSTKGKTILTYRFGLRSVPGDILLPGMFSPQPRKKPRTTGPHLTEAEAVAPVAPVPGSVPHYPSGAVGHVALASLSVLSWSFRLHWSWGEELVEGSAWRF